MAKPKIEPGKLSDFRPQVENANAHTERGLKSLEDAYDEVGYVAPMTAASDGEIIDGSARLEKSFGQFDDEALVVRHDGSKPIIMVREDIKDATDPKAKRISYGANRIGEIDLAWDPGQVLADIEAGVDLGGLFQDDELDELLAGLGVDEPPLEEEAPPVDKAEELQEKWGCETGQVWHIESVALPGRYHRLICGDCREQGDLDALLDGEKVNGVFTSPPYAMQRAKQYGGVPVGEYVDWWEAVQANVRSVLAKDGSFFVNIKPHCEDGQRVLYVMDLVQAMVREWGWRFVDELCWKRVSIPAKWSNRFKNYFEPVYHFSMIDRCKFRPDNVLRDFSENSDKYNTYDSGLSTIISDSRPSGFDLNGSMKSQYVNQAYPSNVIECSGGISGIQAATFPTKLPTFFLKAYSDPGDIWLDPFCGSGTVIVAAENEGRLGMGVEKLPKYCAVILERLEASTGRPAELVAG